MLPIANSKFNEYVDEVNHLSASGVSNSLAVARLKRSVDEHIKVSAAEGYVLRAMIASLENKPHEVIVGLFNKAACLDSAGWFLFQNYAVSMLKRGFVNNAYEAASTAFRLSRLNEITLGFSVPIYQEACLASFRIHELAENDTGVREMADFLSHKGISDEDLRSYADIIQNIAIGHLMVTDSVSWTLIGEDELLYISYYLKMPVNDVSLLSDHLVDELLSRDIPAKLLRSVGLGFKIV